MSVRLAIGDHVIVESSTDARHIIQWLGPDNPPPGWYRAFVSMKYHIRFVGGTPPYRMFELTPVMGANVYTFDRLEDIIASTRGTSIHLLFTPALPLAEDLQFYRVTTHPPVEHFLYGRPSLSYEED